MVKLHTSTGAFEYTGCNNKVTVAQLKAYLKFNGISFGSKILKKDLCHIVNRLQQQIQKVKSGKQQGMPILNFMFSQTQQQKKTRLGKCSVCKPKKTVTKKTITKKTTLKRRRVVRKRKTVKRRVKRRVVRRRKTVKRRVVRRRKTVKRRVVRRRKTVKRRVVRRRIHKKK